MLVAAVAHSAFPVIAAFNWCVVAVCCLLLLLLPPLQVLHVHIATCGHA
jgi:hypothetical protein